MYFVYHQGQYVNLDAQHLNILDSGLIRGYGAFEFTRTYKKQPFQLEAHVDRLFQSCEMLDLKIQETKKEILDICENVLKQTLVDESKLGLIVTGNVLGKEAHLFVFSSPLELISKEWVEEGIKTQTVLYERFLPKCKSFQYLPQMATLKKNPSIQEVLYLNNNQEITEGGTSNFFGFEKDCLITANQNILLGITRQCVLELAKSEFAIDFRALPLEEASHLDEAFMTSSTREIIPIKQIDHIQIGDGKVGSHTKRLQQLFYQLTMQVK